MTEIPTIDGFLARVVRSLGADALAPWSLAPDADLKSVWARIDYHGIAILLHAQAPQLRDWPDPLIERITEEARLMALWEMTHHKTVSKLVGELRAAGIESVIMKGTALAYSLHSDPAMRRRGDTDLLVHPDDRERTRAILERLGWYRKHDPHGLYFQEGWLHEAAGYFEHFVDLHWEPSDRPVLHRLLPIRECFASRAPLTRFMEGAFRPSLPLMLIHATINQKWHSRHGYYAEDGRIKDARRLIWSVDFDLMVRHMTSADWDWLTRHCTRLGAGPLVAEALRGAQHDLGTALPEGPLAALEGHPLNPDYAVTFSDADTLTQFWLDFRRAGSWALRGQMLLHRGLPPRDHLLERYPSASGWPTPMLQVRLLLDTAGRMLRRLTAS